MERVDYESLIISDLLNFHSARALDINPWYQRRSVWSPPQKSYLINTIFERKPVPSIYIRQMIDVENERSIKEVVDGQQRIRSVLSYKDDEFSARHPAHKNRVKYSELSRPERERFLSTALSVGYLIGADDRDVIEIFGRINSVAKTLNPMERMNAQFSGDFKQFCLREAAARVPFWRATNLFSATGESVGHGVGKDHNMRQSDRTTRDLVGIDRAVRHVRFAGIERGYDQWQSAGRIADEVYDVSDLLIARDQTRLGGDRPSMPLQARFLFYPSDDAGHSRTEVACLPKHRDVLVDTKPGNLATADDRDLGDPGAPRNVAVGVVDSRQPTVDLGLL
jgi:Protein of unknown function DUF262